MTDQQAVDAVLEGNKEAFRVIVDRYKDKLYGVCLRLLQNEVDAQDALQESFIEIFKHIAAYKFKSSLSTWMYTITYRTTIKNFNKNKHLPIFDSANNSEIVDENEEVQIDPMVVRGKAAKLKPVEYNLFELYYMDNLSVAEINEITSFSSSKIKSMLMRIRKKLKVELEKELYGN